LVYLVYLVYLNLVKPCKTLTLDGQKAKVGIKVGESQASGGTQAREKRWETTKGA
jgi:hypothetical protein